MPTLLVVCHLKKEKKRKKNYATLLLVASWGTIQIASCVGLKEGKSIICLFPHIYLFVFPSSHEITYSLCEVIKCYRLRQSSKFN